MKKLISIWIAMAVLAFFNSVAMARDLTASEKDIVIKAVKSELIDPNGARFKWVKISPKFTFDNEKDFANYCVLVSAKNAFGKFVADKPFMVFLIWSKAEGFSATLTDKPDSSNPQGIFHICAEEGYTDFSSAK